MRGDARVVRCRACSLCAAWLPAGFTASERMRCTRTGDDVGPGDGCTLGEAGAPSRGAEAYDVDLSASRWEGASPWGEDSSRRGGRRRTGAR